MLVCISSTGNNIAFYSKKLIWVFLGLFGIALSCGVVSLDYLGLIAFHIVNIISLTSVGRAFDNLEKEIQIKKLPAFPGLRANVKRWERRKN